jgi:CRISPR system Cascade subunit CasA
VPPSNASAYSLLTEPWLPVLDLDGRSRAVSLLDVFRAATVIDRLVGDVPGQEPALIRLLLAILHRALDGPADVDGWRALWEADGLPVVRIEAYLKRWADCFDLFHPQTPFFQVADLTTRRNTAGLEDLFPKTADQVRAFSRYPEAVPDLLSPAAAARWLIHLQAWDVAGIKTAATGDGQAKQGKAYGNRTGPLGLYGVIVARGRSLRDTLLLNLLPGDDGYRRDRDVPCWERGPLTAQWQKRPPCGPLDLFTWQSRRVRLLTAREGERPTVTGALVCGGDRFDVHEVFDKDPHTGWRRSQRQERNLGRVPVYLPAGHVFGRQVWRGLTAMLPAVADVPGRQPAAKLPPLVLTWLGRLVDTGILSGNTVVSLGAFGCLYGQQSAVVEDTLADDIPIALAILRLSNWAAAALVDECARDAEAVAVALRWLGADLTRASGGLDDAQARASGEELAGLLYHAVDGSFRTLLRDADEFDPLTGRQLWQRLLLRTARRIAEQALTDTSPAAFAGRDHRGHHLSSVLAEVWFQARLAEKLPLTRTSAQGDVA